jgi:XRE family transcriptional regulator, fatty acid utilization regulator
VYVFDKIVLWKCKYLYNPAFFRRTRSRVTAQDRKLFAGARLRRLRLHQALTQTRMADDLGVSVSYLNLIERNQRPLTAAFLLKLATTYNLDLRQLTGDDGDAIAAELARVMADPLLVGISAGRAELADVAASAPGVAAALLRLHALVERAAAASPATQSPGAVELVGRFLLERRNHFPELDAACEAIADDLRLASADVGDAMAERLRVRHGLRVRILPIEAMPDLLRRLDLHARQLQLSESLDGSSRRFNMAYQIALSELRPVIDAQLVGADFGTDEGDRSGARLGVQTLANYAAAAIMMPYGRFHASCEALSYDLELLQARFGAGFEQVAHRLTTLQRPGARGVPFFMLRVDRAGNVSKRFAATQSPLARGGGHCPLWKLHAAFDRPGAIVRHVVELEDGSRYLSVARTVRAYAAPYGAPSPEFAIGLGCDLAHARGLVYAQGLDLANPAVTPIGLGCAACTRAGCRQRSIAPTVARLSIDENSRGFAPFRFEA